MNTTHDPGARRVILAGISEERLDLFLLLNEGAGYEVTGVIDARGTGESSRIAEILGVPVLGDENAETLPEADLLIYGDDRFRPMGTRLALDADAIWHENEAWRVLTEGGNGDGAESDEGPADDEALARAADEWREADDAEPPSDDRATEASETLPPGGAGTSAVDRHDTLAAEPAASTGTAWGASEGPATPPSLASARGGEARSTPEAFALLHEFAVASGDLESLYLWILERAIGMSGAAAGGIRPREPVRPYVWRDRRATPRGELPAFLRTDADEAHGHTEVALGGPETPGGGRLLLVAPTRDVGGDLPLFVEAIAPALRTAAELDDRRRDRAWEDLIRKVASDLEDTERIGDAIADACRRLAETLRARECVLLFRSTDGEVVRGYSSNGQRIVAPAESGLFGGTAGDRPRRFVDEDGLWHYHVPFATGSRRGAMGLFGVTTGPGAVEALGHQAIGLAKTLAERLPEAAWQA